LLDFIGSVYAESQARPLVPEGCNPAKRAKRCAVMTAETYSGQRQAGVR
jgi:hypothetical protein